MKHFCGTQNSIKDVEDGVWKLMPILAQDHPPRVLIDKEGHHVGQIAEVAEQGPDHL